MSICASIIHTYVQLHIMWVHGHYFLAVHCGWIEPHQSYLPLNERYFTVPVGTETLMER